MRSSLCLVACLVACGDDAAGPTDASIRDAMLDASGRCNYTEANDTSNDTLDGGIAETTGVAVGAGRVVVCGSFASTHHDGDITVDVDAFHVTAAGVTDVAVRIDGDAGAIELVGVEVYGGPTLTTLIGTTTFYGDHGVGTVHLQAGTFELLVFALNAQGIATPIAYEVEIVNDDPSQRCPEVTAGGYPEANDGGNNTGNDVYTIPSGSPPALTTSGADAAEPTGITLAPQADTRVTGSAADVAVTDQYEDKDTFAFTTGATTNELTVRLTWTASGDLDFLLFEGTKLQPELRAITAAVTGPELRTYAIKPSTSYALVIAARPTATFPVAYTASLCGAAYQPP